MRVLRYAMLAPALLAAAYGQNFEVASVKANPQSGFHLAADSVSGGPGTADPAMFRCSRCSLATLIVKAFNLQPYQFPGRTALADSTYEVAARVPAGATASEFSVMLQNLLKDRFGLEGHFQEKKMKGYHLVAGKNGPKLKESSDATPAAAPADSGHRGGPGEAHNHTGAIVFGGTASFRAANQTTADLARVLSDQIGLPVDDQTGLTGKYDIALRWSGAASASSAGHGDGGWSGGGHSGHDGGGAPAGAAADPSGPALFDALQQQLGLRLVSAEQAVARLFVIDKIAPHPTEN